MLVMLRDKQTKKHNDQDWDYLCYGIPWDSLCNGKQ